MDHDEIAYELSHAPSLKLLQKDTAALIISFLYHAFKRSHRVAIPYGEVLAQLDDILLDLNTDQPDHYPRSAHEYLKTWSDDDHRLLRLYYERGQDEPLVELTPDAERVIGWFEDLQKREFVGTESRFMRVFELLEDIAGKSTEDAATRLAQLERQRNALQQEIDAIVQTGRVQRYTETQIKERFREANDVARRLLADFREVEQNFRAIARDVQVKHMEEGASRGSVVAHVLDADEALKASDQGRSFYSFWEFLISPARQEQLRALIEAVYALPELETLRQEQRGLRRIKTSLIEAGEKVAQSNLRLAEQLRYLLDDRQRAEGRRVIELIEDIKRMARSVVLSPPPDIDFLLLEGPPEVRLVMERPLWEPPESLDFSEQRVVAGAEPMDTLDLAPLYGGFYVDSAALRQRIDTVLETRPEVTLAELTRRYPIRQGLSELLAYLSIAIDDERHAIDVGARDQVALPAPTPEAAAPTLTLPRVVFRGQPRS
ncbi:MAG: DUF3375 domain-containing protein [Anaerolineae bacterium]